MQDAEASVVNPHVLAHMVSAGAQHGLEASEDIVSGSGIKLLAKGSRIDAATSCRLLEHKLRRPLEQCVQVIGGVDPAALAAVARQMLEQHPLLQRICDDGYTPGVVDMLGQLKLAPQPKALLTLYAARETGRIEHTVGVAMLVFGLARRLLRGEPERQRELAIAGLLHDVGELYIDPGCLHKGQRLGPQQWRHIVTHPIVGHRVLLGLPGSSRLIAEAVRDHHERLDGFGYPRGVQGSQLALPGQLLAAAEWLMAMIESGPAPMSRVSTATRLIQGEFSPEVLELVSSLSNRSDEVLGAMAESQSEFEQAAGRLTRLSRTLRNFRATRPWIDEQTERARGPLQHILQGGTARTLRIQTAFASTGLDGEQPQQLLSELAAAGDLALWLEVNSIVRELAWRMREVERTSLLRAGLLSPGDAALMEELIKRLTAEPTPE